MMSQDQFIQSMCPFHAVGNVSYSLASLDGIEADIFIEEPMAHMKIRTFMMNEQNSAQKNWRTAESNMSMLNNLLLKQVFSV